MEKISDDDLDHVAGGEEESNSLFLKCGNCGKIFAPFLCGCVCPQCHTYNTPGDHRYYGPV